MNLKKVFSSKKEIVLNCYTYMGHAYRYASPASAIDFLPDWWKALPAPRKTYSFSEGVGWNMKYCIGMTDLYRKALVLPLWSELNVRVSSGGDPNVDYRFADGVSTAKTHAQCEYEGFSNPSVAKHLKLDSPWHFETDEDVSWVVVPPVYNHDLGAYSVLPGVLNFKQQHATNIQMMLRTPPEGAVEVHVPFRTPMLLLKPLSERSFVVKTHLVTVEEFNRLHGQPPTVVRSGLIIRALHKAGVAKPVCPFSSSTDEVLK